MENPEPLSGRYRFVRRLRGPAKSLIWLTTDEETGRPIVASLLPAARAEFLLRLVGMSHPHLATVVQVLDRFEPTEIPEDVPKNGDSRLVLAHYVAGRTLSRRLEAGPLPPGRAIQWTEKLADALVAIHARNGAHGAVSPRSILAARVDRGVTPLLSHLVAPPSGPYCSPERVTGAGPSPEDDVWALCATLYTSLTNTPPFAGSTRRKLAEEILKAEIAKSSVLDDELRAIVEKGLSRDRRSRLTSAEGLRDALRAWLASHDEEEPGPASDSTPPPPEGDVSEPPEPIGESVVLAAVDIGLGLESLRAHTKKASPSPPSPSSSAPSEEGPSERTNKGGRAPTRSRVWAFLLAGVVFGTGAGVLFNTLPKEHRTASIGQPRSELPAPGSALETASALRPAASADSEPRATEPSSPQETETPTQCMQRLMPEGTLGKEADVGFVCTSTDLWRVSRKFFSQVANHGSGDGVKTWVYLTRYELPALALLRGACCPDAPRFEAATPKTACGSLTEPIVAFSRDPSETRIDDYEKTVACLIAREVHYPEPWDRVNPKEAREYFVQFLEFLKTQSPP